MHPSRVSSPPHSQLCSLHAYYVYLNNKRMNIKKNRKTLQNKPKIIQIMQKILAIIRFPNNFTSSFSFTYTECLM